MGYLCLWWFVWLSFAIRLLDCLVLFSFSFIWCLLVLGLIIVILVYCCVWLWFGVDLVVVFVWVLCICFEFGQFDCWFEVLWRLVLWCWLAEYDLVLCGFLVFGWGFVGLDYLVGGLIWVFALICACVCYFGVLFSCCYLWVIYSCLELSFLFVWFVLARLIWHVFMVAWLLWFCCFAVFVGFWVFSWFIGLSFWICF